MGGRRWARRVHPGCSPRRPPVDTLHRALPAIAENSADLANLVEGPTTTANSGVYSFPGTTASFPGPPTPESSPTTIRQFRSRTSTGVRQPRGLSAPTLTSRTSGPTADRPVLTTPLSLGPRDSFPADYSAEDSPTTSTRTCPEPPSPPLHPGSRNTAGTASSIEFVSPFTPRRPRAIIRNLSGRSSKTPPTRHGHPPVASTPPINPSTTSGTEAGYDSTSPTTPGRIPQDCSLPPLRDPASTPTLTPDLFLLFWDPSSVFSQ